MQLAALPSVLFKLFRKIVKIKYQLRYVSLCVDRPAHMEQLGSY